jgi:hypothetical protein
LQAPTPAEFDNFNAMAFEAMKPDLETSLSLANFLLELRELPQLWTLWYRWRRRFYRHDWGALKKFTLRELAEMHLTYSFGISPFFADVLKMWEVFQTFEDRINTFLDKAGKINTRHWRYKSDEVVLTSVPYSTDFMTVTKEIRSSTEYHFTMVYSYTVKDDLRSKMGKLKALREMLGLRVTPEVIWNAIPFSFIVDWFLPIGDILKQFDQPLVDAELNVIQYGGSWKTKSTGKVTILHRGKCSDDSMHSVQSASASAKLYKRCRCLPNSGAYYFTGSRFGPTQLALSASLLAVNWPKRAYR